MKPATVASLRRSLLMKMVSPRTPTREELSSLIEMLASTLVECVSAQAITFYIVDGNHISSTQVRYSKSLWEGDAQKEKRFSEQAAELLALKIPRGQGVVGKVIETGEPFFCRDAERRSLFVTSMPESSGFTVRTMLVVPLRTTATLGAIELINKETAPGRVGDFTEADLTLITEFGEYASTLIHRVADPNYRPAPEAAAKYMARLTQVPLITQAGELAVDESLVATIGEALIRRDGVFPYRLLAPNSVAAAMGNPLDYPARDRFTQATGHTIDEVCVVPRPVFDALLAQYCHAAVTAETDVERIDIRDVGEIITQAYGRVDGKQALRALIEEDDASPVVQLTNRVVEDAYISGASDVHIEPTEHELVVRYRIDGICHDKLRLPRQAAAAVVARIKIMCNLDIAETRLPQDGRIVFKNFTRKNIDVDLRVAVCPTSHGEKVVMRLLDKTKSALPLTALGFSDENLMKYRECIRQPYGMILHCGPTGAGKSMTLYSALGEMNSRDVNIQTAEDPIEYTLAGLNQTQMNRQIGLTFARALRSYLRMDPDIILVGEIRDQETAQIAVEAALTGHLLVSTLHTNDASSTIARLCEMGIEPFNISTSLVCICAQRLLRRVCKSCRVRHTPKDREESILYQALGWTGEIFQANPQGCPACAGTGYRGRVGIHELMLNTPELTDRINKGAESIELKRVAMRAGMKTLHQDSMLKVQAGITTMEEAIGAVPPDIALSAPARVPLVECA